MATTLTGVSQQTEWWDLRPFGDGVCFNLTGNFATAVSIHYSNNPDVAKGTDYTTGSATYAAAIGPLRLPPGLADFVRFASSGSWSAGTTCSPSFAVSRNANGQLVKPAPQEQN
jgi:hypothetical protein